MVEPEAARAAARARRAARRARPAAVKSWWRRCWRSTWPRGLAGRGAGGRGRAGDRAQGRLTVRRLAMVWLRDRASPGRPARGGACRPRRAARRGGSGSAGVVGRACSGGSLRCFGRRVVATGGSRALLSSAGRFRAIANRRGLSPSRTDSDRAGRGRARTGFPKKSPPAPRAPRGSSNTTRRPRRPGTRARSGWRSASCAPAGSTAPPGDQRARAARIRDRAVYDNGG